MILIYDAVFLTTLINIKEGLGREGSLNAHAGHPPRTDAVILWGGDDECGLNGETRQI